MTTIKDSKSGLTALHIKSAMISNSNSGRDSILSLTALDKEVTPITNYNSRQKLQQKSDYDGRHHFGDNATRYQSTDDGKQKFDTNSFWYESEGGGGRLVLRPSGVSDKLTDGHKHLREVA